MHAHAHAGTPQSTHPICGTICGHGTVCGTDRQKRTQGRRGWPVQYSTYAMHVWSPGRACPPHRHAMQRLALTPTKLLRDNAGHREPAADRSRAQQPAEAQRPVAMAVSLTLTLSGGPPASPQPARHSRWRRWRLIESRPVRTGRLGSGVRGLVPAQDRYRGRYQWGEGEGEGHCMPMGARRLALAARFGGGEIGPGEIA